MLALDPVKTATIDPGARYAALVQNTGVMTTPIVTGAPRWLNARNMLVGGGIALASYLAYGFLKPKRKTGGQTMGRISLKRLFKRSRSRRR